MNPDDLDVVVIALACLVLWVLFGLMGLTL